MKRQHLRHRRDTHLAEALLYFEEVLVCAFPHYKLMNICYTARQFTPNMPLSAPFQIWRLENRKI
jgi:hypothetical protein